MIIGHTKVLSLIQPEDARIAFATDLENRGDHLKIYNGPGFINIDCGCGYEMPIKKLACIRLEDMLEYYQEKGVIGWLPTRSFISSKVSKIQHLVELIGAENRCFS